MDCNPHYKSAQMFQGFHRTSKYTPGGKGGELGGVTHVEVW